jgi:hypothetical protein
VTPNHGCGRRSKHLLPADALARIESKARSPNPPRAITPHYRVDGRASWRARAGRDGRLTAEESPTRTKSRRKMMGSPIFPGIEHIIACGKSRRALTPRSGTAIFRGIESPADGVESISRDFSAAPEANRPRKRSAEVRCRVAHAEPPVCHQDHGARKHAPKRAIRGTGRS